VGLIRFLLDTGIAGDFVSRKEPVRQRVIAEVRRGNRVGIRTPVLAELTAGIEASETRERNRQRLELALADLRLWPFDEQAAREYGRLAAELRRIGRPMQQIDIMVAAIARVLGKCTVVTLDSDLSAVPGLRVENWRTPASEG
jgi:tRNA(fMet)-specific endonuclease VapC